MHSFVFSEKTKLISGAGSLSFVGKELTQRGISRALILTDSFLGQSDIVKRLEQILNASQIQTILDTSVKPNPRDVDCEATALLAQQFHAQAIVALGGGSSMDQGKAAAVLCTNHGSIQDYEERDLPCAPLPLFCIPTTAGTGSEVTYVAVITDTKRRFKMSILDSDKLYPTVAICDPELTLSLPKGLTASCGMDTLTHAIEAFTAKERNPFSDALALEATKLVGDYLLAAYENGYNLEAREKMLIASSMAGMAFINSNVGAVHAIAETIGAWYDIPHGVANSIFLPYIVEFNQLSCAERYQKLAYCLRTENLVQKIREMNRTLSIPLYNKLEKVCIEDIPMLAQKAEKNSLSLSNVRTITAEDYRHILQKAYGETEW